MDRYQELLQICVEAQLKKDGYAKKGLKAKADNIYVDVQTHLITYLKDLNTEIANETDTDEQKTVRKNYLDKYISQEYRSYFKTTSTKKKVKRELLKKCLLSRELPLGNLLAGKDIEPRSKDYFSVYVRKNGWNDFKAFCQKIENYSEEDIDIVRNKIITVIEKKPRRKKRISNLKFFGIILFVSFCLGFLYSTFFEKNTVPLKYEEMGSVFKSQDSTTFKLLLLPFKNDVKCQEPERIDYISHVKERYGDISRKKNYNIEIQHVGRVPSSFSALDVTTILNSSDIDLVVWGRYEEECNGDKSLLNIHHAPVVSLAMKMENQGVAIEISDDFFEKTGLQRLETTEQIREGYLLEKVDEIIFFKMAFSLVLNNDYEQALCIIGDFYQLNGPNPKMLFLESLIAFHQEEYKLSKQYAKEFITTNYFENLSSTIADCELVERYDFIKNEIQEDIFLFGVWVLFGFSNVALSDPVGMESLLPLHRDTPDGIFTWELSPASTSIYLTTGQEISSKIRVLERHENGLPKVIEKIVIWEEYDYPNGEREVIKRTQIIKIFCEGEEIARTETPLNID